MLTTDGECRIGAPRGPISSSIVRVSANSCASGISSQRNRGAAHIDGEQAVFLTPASHRSGSRGEFKRGAAGLFAKQRRHAAHAVAAGARFGAIVVVDADRGILIAARRIERHQLIVRLLLRRGARFGGSDRDFRRRRKSTMTISLPRPFILTKSRFASALMIKPENVSDLYENSIHLRQWPR